jgi:hypothetical protein
LFSHIVALEATPDATSSDRHTVNDDDRYDDVLNHLHVLTVISSLAVVLFPCHHTALFAVQVVAMALLRDSAIDRKTAIIILTTVTKRIAAFVVCVAIGCIVFGVAIAVLGILSHAGYTQ